MSLYRAVVLNPSVKITPPKPPRQQPAFFFNYELSIRNLLGNYRRTLSVGSYRLKYFIDKSVAIKRISGCVSFSGRTCRDVLLFGRLGDGILTKIDYIGAGGG
jgi:hypothetical protein